MLFITVHYNLYDHKALIASVLSNSLDTRFLFHSLMRRILVYNETLPYRALKMWSFILDFLTTFPYGDPIFVGSFIHQVSDIRLWGHYMTESEFSSTFANTSAIGFTLVLLELLELGSFHVLLNQNTIRQNEVLIPYNVDLLNLLEPKLRLDSRLYLYKVKERNIDLIQCYSFKQRVIIEHIGSWNHNFGLRVKNECLSIKCRSNFHGSPIIAGSLSNPPFTIYSNPTSPSGYFEEVIQVLALKMNFTLKTQFPPDHQWGSLDDQGQWNGLIMELIRKNNDVVVGGLSYLTERSLVIQYSDIVHMNYYSLIFPPPKGKT